MPVIKPFTARTDVPGPQQIRLQRPDVSEGRALQQLGQTVSTKGRILERREEQREVSRLSAEMAQAQSELSIEFENTMRSHAPGDPPLVEVFSDKVNERLERIRENVSTEGGRNFFNRSSAGINSHFLKSSFQGQFELAAAEAKQNYTTAINGYSSALITDPSAFEMTLENHQAQIESMQESGQIDFKLSTELKSKGEAELAKSAVRGWVKANPSFAREQLESGKFDRFMTGSTKKQLFGEIEQAERAAEVQKRKDEFDSKEARDQEFNLIQNDFMAKYVSGKLSAQEVLDSPLEPFGKGSKNQFINMIEAQNRRGKEVRTNPRVFNDLFRRIHLDPVEPDALRDENDLNEFVIKGDITYADLNRLRTEMQGKRTEAGGIESQMKRGLLNVAKNRFIKKGFGIPDPDGAEQLQAYTVWFLEEYNRLKQKGKTATELLSPDSPDYLGKAISNFERSNQERMKSMSDRLRQENRQRLQPLPPSLQQNQITPRQEGESVEDYLKRTGG